MSPNKAIENKDKIEQINEYKLQDVRLKQALQKPWKKDDHIRIKIDKNIFEKGYEPNWSDKIYTIQSKYANSYKLKEIDNRRFQRHDLQKISDLQCFNSLGAIHPFPQLFQSILGRFLCFSSCTVNGQTYRVWQHWS